MNIHVPLYWELFSLLRSSSSLACKKPYPSEGLLCQGTHLRLAIMVLSQWGPKWGKGITALWSDSYLVDHIISLKNWNSNEVINNFIDIYFLKNRIVNFQDWLEAEFIGVLETMTRKRIFLNVFLSDQHLFLNKKLSKHLLKL